MEEALRTAAQRALASATELETARSLAVRLVGPKDMALDEARRATPILEHLFPKAEMACGFALSGTARTIQATLIAAKLDAASGTHHRGVQSDSPFFKVGDPTMYDGENLDIPAFVRKEIALPGSPPKVVPEQKTLFDNREPQPT